MLFGDVDKISVVKHTLSTNSCQLISMLSIPPPTLIQSSALYAYLGVRILIRRKDGTRYERRPLLWNPTVANLTLMALGSSAPEILLSSIEIIKEGFSAGELGPGTIVGSAAYNLFVIPAICILAVNGMLLLVPGKF